MFVLIYRVVLLVITRGDSQVVASQSALGLLAGVAQKGETQKPRVALRGFHLKRSEVCGFLWGL